MARFLKFLDAEDYEIIIEIPEDALIYADKTILKESRWEDSSLSGWVVRVDPSRPEMKQQRHVHVAEKKHTRSKMDQAAWNEDGSRHDKSTFNDAIGNREKIKEVARKALGLPDSAVLEIFASTGRGPAGAAHTYIIEITSVAKNDFLNESAVRIKFP